MKLTQVAEPEPPPKALTGEHEPPAGEKAEAKPGVSALTIILLSVGVVAGAIAASSILRGRKR